MLISHSLYSNPLFTNSSASLLFNTPTANHWTLSISHVPLEKAYLIMEISFSLFRFAQSGCLIMKWCLYAYLLLLRQAIASYSRYLVKGSRVYLHRDTVTCWMKELHVKPGLSCGRFGICIHQKMGFHTTLRNNGWWVSDVRICVPSRGQRENWRLWLILSLEFCRISH